MYKILFVSHSSNLYGAERFLWTLVSKIDRTVYCPITTLPQDSEFSNQLRKGGVLVEIIRSKWWVNERWPFIKQILYFPLHVITIFKTMAVIARYNVDLVFTNTSVVPHGAIAAFLMRKKHIWYIHEYFDASTAYLKFFFGMRGLCSIIAMLSNRILVNSEFVKTVLGKQIARKAFVVYNGFDLNVSIDIPEVDCRSEYEISKESSVLAVIGSITARKRIVETIRAFACLRKTKQMNSVLLIVGEVVPQDLYAQEVYKVISQEKLGDSVKLVGYVEDMKKIYTIMDVLIHLPSSEAFGRVLVEAALYGKPVVAYRTGGIPEIVKDESQGILIDSIEPEVVSDAIYDVLKNRDVFTPKSSMIKRFSIDNTIKELESHLHAVIQEL